MRYGASRILAAGVLVCAVAGVLVAVPGQVTASAAQGGSGGSVPAGALYLPLAPVRVLDTRAGLGAPKQVVAAHQSVTLQVGGATVVPWNASAVAVNVTVVSPTTSGWVSVGPSVVTDSSNVNFVAGRTIANLAVVRLSSTGSITFYNGSAGTVHLVADLQGYYAAPGIKFSSGARYTALTPVRVLDTRSGLGATKHSVGAHQSVTLNILQEVGSATVPIGASAVAVNLTVVSPTTGGWVSVGPSVVTDSSNVNFVAGRTIANLAVVRLSSTGSITFYNGSAGTVHLVADLQGYYAALGDGTAYTPVSTVRVLDTRTGSGAAQHSVASHQSITLQVRGAASVPTGAAAVMVNVTAVSPAATGWVSVGPVALTGSSNLNFAAGRTTANLAIAQISSTGSITFYNGSPGTVHLIADLQGYTTPSPVCSGTCTVWSWNWPSTIPTQVSGLANVIAVAGNGNTSYALHADGTVWAWGRGIYGELGDGAGVNSSIPVQVSGLRDVTSIATYARLALALRSDGTVWAWGAGPSGETGGACQGVYCLIPGQVPGLTDIVAVASGADAEYALRSDGTVWAWGGAAFGQLGTGTGLGCCSSEVRQVMDLTNVTAIAGGYFAGYALRSDGTVWAWGDGERGRLGNGGTSNSNVPVQVSALAQVTAIAAGTDTYALRADGTVWAWGIGDPGLGTSATSTADGLVPAQVGVVTHVTAIATSWGGEAYAVQSDGTAWTWGNGPDLPISMDSLAHVAAIAACGYDGYAITDTP